MRNLAQERLTTPGIQQYADSGSHVMAFRIMQKAPGNQASQLGKCLSDHLGFLLVSTENDMPDEPERKNQRSDDVSAAHAASTSRFIQSHVMVDAQPILLNPDALYVVGYQELAPDQIKRHFVLNASTSCENQPTHATHHPFSSQDKWGVVHVAYCPNTSDTGPSLRFMQFLCSEAAARRLEAGTAAEPSLPLAQPITLWQSRTVMPQ
ncbi:MAG: hypothetical protein IPI58_01180 [Alphaproteobacteria bacterium]|nr:MAG: hypothetical protein IPI58_01180 [Alphaproteobacteria bacterium]